MSRQILICDSADHAELVDALVFARIQDEEQAQGNRWSGVLTDGTRFGILWASPVSDLFGIPEDFPELAVVDDPENAFSELPPPEPEQAP